MSSNGDGEFNASVAWQRAESMATRTAAVQLTTHELGHNLTLSHAGSRDFGAEALGPIGATGTLSEYGDPFSTMGSWNFGFYAASQAANQLRWLGAGSNYTVVETSGTYTIQGYETRPAGVKALKVRRGTGNNSWLWLESRQNVGSYSSRLDLVRVRRCAGPLRGHHYRQRFAPAGLHAGDERASPTQRCPPAAAGPIRTAT